MLLVEKSLKVAKNVQFWRRSWRKKHLNMGKPCIPSYLAPNNSTAYYDIKVVKNSYNFLSSYFKFTQLQDCGLAYYLARPKWSDNCNDCLFYLKRNAIPQRVHYCDKYLYFSAQNTPCVRKKFNKQIIMRQSLSNPQSCLSMLFNKD